MSERGCIALEVRVADEPATYWPAVRPALQEYFESIDDVPATIWITSPTGHAGRTRRFSWETLDALVADAATGTIASYELQSRPLEDRPGARATFDMTSTYVTTRSSNVPTRPRRGCC